MSAPDPTPSRLPLLLLRVVLIVVAGCWVFAPAMQGGWIWDDTVYIPKNAVIRDPHGLWTIWFGLGQMIEYYPIEATIRWCQWQLWHNDTFGYHVTNIVLHIANALLVWRLLAKFGLRWAWLGGLVFVLHPGNVESVAWIAELKNTLSLTPFLLALCAWVDYEETKRPAFYLATLGLFLIAMLCKISMAPFPVAMLLYAWWKRGRVSARDIAASLPFFVVSIVLGLTTIWAGIHYLQARHGVEIPEWTGPASGLALAGQTFSYYFLRFFLPFNLLPLYPRWTVDPGSPLAWAPWIFWGALLFWLWRGRDGWQRHVLLGFGFFLLFIAPFTGLHWVSFMRFSWVMDHFLYIPMIGLIGLVVAGCEHLSQRLPTAFRPYEMIFLGLVMLVLAGKSHAYAGQYASERQFWTYTLTGNPDAPTVRNNLGLVLAQEGKLDEAAEQFQKILEADPLNASATNNLGNVERRRGHIPEAQALFEKACQLDPTYAEPHNNLAGLLLGQGKTDEAMAQAQMALALDPEFPEAYNNLGNAFISAQRLPEAISQFQKALALDPAYAEAHNGLAYALFQSQKTNEAEAEARQALQLKPDYAEAHGVLAMILTDEGRLPEAIDQMERAHELAPQNRMFAALLKSMKEKAEQASPSGGGK